MERTRLIVNFDSSCDKLLSTENVVARGETFDILFRDVTLSGTVRVAFWDYDTLLWRSEGSASQGDGGSVLEGLVADTKELADVFRGGSGFFAARLTVGEQVGGDEWRDYGVAYVRLYSGTDPSENPPPARPDVYPTEEELNAWLEAAGEVREGVCTCAKAAASSAEAAASSARLSAAQALNAVNAANGATASAKAASVSAEQAASEGVAAAKSAKAAKAAENAAVQSATQANASAQAASSSATAAAGSATQAEEAKAEVQASAEAVGKNLFGNSILTVDGMDGASYFLRDDVLIAGDGRHYILCRQDKDKNTTRVQVFGPAYPIFGNAPLYDFTAKTLLNTNISNYCPGAAIHEGALYFWEAHISNTKKIDLATGELLANDNSGHRIQGPGFINRKNGHVFRAPNFSTLYRFDADLVALDPLPIPEGEDSNVYNKVKVVYIHDVTYAQFSTGRFFWLDAEDVWHLVTDSDGDEVRSGTYDGANVAKTLAVWSKMWPGEVEDATGAKKRIVQVSNLKQKWLTTGYGADGEAIWAKNGMHNIGGGVVIKRSWCIHGANTGPCDVNVGFPVYLRDYNAGNTTRHIFSNADLSATGHGEPNGIVPPIITGGNNEFNTSLCYRQPFNWRFIP